MINFVNGSPNLVLEWHNGYGRFAGSLATPESGNDMKIAARLGMPWALDNGCFKTYDPPGIVRMLRRFRGVSGCKFAVVPDVVCDHDSTLLLFRAWIGTYQRLGYPAAFVLQNGVSINAVPWGSVAAVFIGGDTPFKFCDLVRELVGEAKQRGKWVHMGRVNSIRRIQYANSIGCDSIDGTGFSMIPKQKINELKRFYGADRQMNIWELPVL